MERSGMCAGTCLHWNCHSPIYTSRAIWTIMHNRDLPVTVMHIIPTKLLQVIQVTASGHQPGQINYQETSPASDQSDRHLSDVFLYLLVIGINPPQTTLL